MLELWFQAWKSVKVRTKRHILVIAQFEESSNEPEHLTGPFLPLPFFYRGIAGRKQEKFRKQEHIHMYYRLLNWKEVSGTQISWVDQCLRGCNLFLVLSRVFFRKRLMLASRCV